MKKILSIILGITLSIQLGAQTPLAFPGAGGAGKYTTGGRGGTVYYVNTLEDTNTGSAIQREGSLRWCLNRSGKRTILFKVSGTIKLTSELRIKNGDVTIAGQTAPGDGICIADYPVTISADNVIIRYLRFRPGDASKGEPDGLGGMDRKNIIIDHCSISWSVDEGLSVYGIENLTVQWCLVSEALRVSSHGKGTHCYGGNWGGNKASYHHNMIAHCESRVPRLGPRASTQQNEFVDIRNNVFYNWAGNGCYGGEGMNVNIVNNYYKPGPATDKASAKVKYRIVSIGVRTESYVTTYPDFAPMKHVWGKFYIDGNKMDGNSEVTKDNWTKGVYAQQSNGEGVDYLWTEKTRDTIRLSQPLDIESVRTHSADLAYQRVLEYVGCSKSRDEVDQRIISDVKNRKATYTASGNKSGYINTPTDTKPAGAGSDWSPWPTLAQDNVPTDSDKDGIPDGWLDSNGYSDKKATDLNEEGYTYLEVYLNSLVHEITENQYKDANSGIEPESRDGIENPVTAQYNKHSNAINVWSQNKMKSIAVYNLMGKQTKNIVCQDFHASINVDNDNSNFYIVKVTTENDKISSVKVMK
ncbi:pectate lyase [Dysgonomonas sp. 520]|nr:pectate lyase [Dysgonomonas sp. 520]NDW08702.1 pectate lyase [Dysgonomonas sp. 520]